MKQFLNISKPRLIYSLLLLAVSGQAFAGNWSSGGGEILEHAQNPWFLAQKNGPNSVSYCVVKGNDFTGDQASVERLVSQSLKWWDEQFSNAHYPDNDFLSLVETPSIKVPLITSEFTKVFDCDKADLAFQFGFLTTQQRQKFQQLKIDLTRYVALTIRTDYDESLKGKGFIYISPDHGADAFVGENVRKNAWDPNGGDSWALRSVLIHELGHVFGLGHAQESDSIMSAKLAEFAVSESNMVTALTATMRSVFFPKAGKVIDDCRGPNPNLEFRRFFKIPLSNECIRAHFSLNSLIIETAAKYDEMQSDWTRVGKAEFKDGGQRRYRQLVSVWLPKGQKFFSDIPKYVNNLVSAAAADVQQSARFYLADGSGYRDLFIQASPRYFQIGGIGPKGIIPDLLPSSSYKTSYSGWVHD